MNDVIELDGAVSAILTEALRAPSAHNAQPWRLVPTGPTAVELHYDHLDYLPFDPDDRDAYLAMGAFYETLSLAAHRHGWRSELVARFSRSGSDLWVGDIALRPARPGERADPLAAADRHTNRNRYDRTPVPADPDDALRALGNATVPPRAIARLVARASIPATRSRWPWTGPRPHLRSPHWRASTSRSPSTGSVTPRRR